MRHSVPSPPVAIVSCHLEQPLRDDTWARFDELQRRRPGGFEFWVFQQNERARRFYELHGCVAVELTDGEGNEERTPDIRYEWRPSRAGAEA